MDNRFKTIVIDGDYLAYLCTFPTQSDRYFVKDAEGNVIVDYPSLASCTSYLLKSRFRY